MTLETYRILHVVGLALMLLGVGGILFAPKDAPKQKLPAMLHGIGLLVMVVAGFGILARLGIAAPDRWSAWVVIKMCVWLLVGALPALIRVGTVPRSMGWLVLVLLVAAAAWLGIQKPTFG